jgi:Uma2 family endonuclease
MTPRLSPNLIPPAFPDHTQLPDSDGTFVKNFQEHPQSILLTDSLEATLKALHPEGDYTIGQDCGIYWRETDPPERGAEAPDWFYVPNVPPFVDGAIRRSYVLWREYIVPLIAIEFASGDGTEERDQTPLLRTEEGTTQKPGKFWVYERIVRIPYYAIYVISTAELEVYNWVNGRYQRLEANERGHYPIAHLGVELGIWEGNYQNQAQRWLRWWDSSGTLLLSGSEQAKLECLYKEQAQEQAEAERERAEAERERADREQQQRERLEAYLRAQGIDPTQI